MIKKTKTVVSVLFLAMLVAFLGCQEKKKDDSSALALLLLKGGGGGSSSVKAQATAEVAASSTVSAAVANAIQTGSFNLLKPEVMLALRNRSRADGPGLIPTMFSGITGICSLVGTTLTCNTTITGTENCPQGGTVTVNVGSGSGLAVNMTSTYTVATSTSNSSSQLTLSAGSNIVYNNCSVTYNDPVTNTSVSTTVNGTVTALSSKTTATGVTSSSGNTVTFNFTTNTVSGPDSLTVSGFSVDGTTLANGTYTTSVAVKGLVSLVFAADNMSGTATITHGTPSTYTVGSTTRVLSGLSQSFGFTCKMSGIVKLCS